jgi:hypothetical protein
MTTNVTATAALCGAAKSSRVNLAARRVQRTPAFLPITFPQAKHTKEVGNSKRSFEETKQAILARQITARAPLPTSSLPDGGTRYLP